MADTIPGTRRRIELNGARLFFPEERWETFNVELSGHWLANTIDERNRSSVSRCQLIQKSASILFPREHVAKAKPVDCRNGSWSCENEI